MPALRSVSAAPESPVQSLVRDETERFVAGHPHSIALAERSAAVWRGGAPFHWMTDWASPSPIFAVEAHGASVVDADGLSYDDFCLADTPAMFGHAPPALVAAVAEQAARGLGYMLPTETAIEVGELLAERFGLPVWQTAVTATDANRAALRWARAITGRNRVLVFDGCYHGMVEETFLTLAGAKPGLIGQATDPTLTAVAVPFNDLAALEAALAGGDIAAVLAEPVMTNCGMIAPDPGFHAALREATRRHGTLLILDETHTLSSGPGGYARAHGLEPDILTLGKAIAGGVPAAVWGVTAEVARHMDEAQRRAGPGASGIGTTLSGNALSLAAMRAMLAEVMTPAAFDRMQAGADRLVAGLEAVIARRRLDWCVVWVGARIELVFAAQPPRDAAAMRRVLDHDLLEAFHLYLINRRLLIAPFHNMMLVSPVTTDEQIDRLVCSVDDFAGALESRRP